MMNENEIEAWDDNIHEPLEKEQVEEVVEEKITVWKCPNCKRMMALNEKCDVCQKGVGDFNVDIDFDEITKQAYEDARKNVEAVKIEDEATETMWLCPDCSFYMKPD